jgi:hypothetical protein
MPWCKDFERRELSDYLLWLRHGYAVERAKASGRV